MNSVNALIWDDLTQPFRCFGPLVTVEEVLRGDLAAGMGSYDARAVAGLTAMARYAAEFLTSGHAELGRSGAVCPFTSGAIQRGLLRMTASDLETLDQGLLVDAVDYFRRTFREAGELKSDPSEIYRSIIIVFPALPELPGRTLIERVQKSLKPAYVDDGLMIGEFYPGCGASGLHNPDFRPLNAPVTSLAIRHMTIWDGPFMVEDERFVQSFRRRFGEEGAKRIAALQKRGAGASSSRRSDGEDARQHV